MPFDHYEPRIGVMKKVEFGISDRGVAALMFQLDAADGVSSSQWVFDMDEVGAIIKASGVRNIRELNHFPCWYTTENNRHRFRGPVSRVDSSRSATYAHWESWQHNTEKAEEEWEALLGLHRKRQEET